MTSNGEGNPSTDSSSSGQEAYCTFRVSELLFGVAVRQVQEVLRSQRTTRVPLAPFSVHGLMNLRGQIVSAIDLRKQLGLDSLTKEQSDAMNVVIRTEDGPTSLMVDEIGDVIAVQSDRFETPPETLQGPPRELIRGAFKLENELLLILDTSCVIKFAA
ncbi:Chemotaxis protein CheW [Stieleria bergensis]|uniref:Chemotaxis protein CheW n=1 Tax=Stieleria bergensis TaxID=2528025 RepID=A0A517SNW0_9BACT|nr:MAG: hypothetical protein CBB71_14320 [Rhodopirellula sp. TMED11]QDT57801.1 Chemotaxis protein CheW [Planctomycetes bacterium SV_7m_r]